MNRVHIHIIEKEEFSPQFNGKPYWIIDISVDENGKYSEIKSLELVEFLSEAYNSPRIKHKPIFYDEYSLALEITKDPNEFKYFLFKNDFDSHDEKDDDDVRLSKEVVWDIFFKQVVNFFNPIRVKKFKDFYE
jgi:hypothetical protein